ncbi:MAG: hypothetical protein NTV51_19695 [Verrucomicrobia bacterium]|nr:hypothetical protein [Verrucomicrobiota bacterium]
MITILLIVSGVIVLASVYFVLASIAHAPEGFEDHTGFHLKTDEVPAEVAAVQPPRRNTRSPHRAGHVPAAPVAAH